MSETPAKAGAEGAVSPRQCVFTTLLGRYERLNEQPVAGRSDIPFLCLTDDPDLRSETWQIRRVTPLFGMDPIRSQRDCKLRPHVHLPDFDASLYIDNSVLLTQAPERLLEHYRAVSGLALPSHSFRDSVLEEFLEVARLGLDDQSRIFEQLNHYLIDFPDALQEKPYWTGIMFRDHTDPTVRAMMEIWAAHVHRYSRRDQLSVNIALRQAGLTPEVIAIDSRTSWFHSWPHSAGRIRESGVRRPAVSQSPPVARVRQLERALAEKEKQKEQALAEQVRTGNAALAEQARQSEQTLSEQARTFEARFTTPTWHVAALLGRYAHRHPYVVRAAWGGVKLLSGVRTLVQHERPCEVAVKPADRRSDVTDSPSSTAGSSPGEAHGGATIYVDPEDERGRQLVLSGKDLNPLSLRMWRRLISGAAWTHIIDIGANYGEMLVNVDLRPDVKVIAVEPNPRILPYLELTLSEAGVAADVVPCAVAEYVGSAQLLVDRQWSGKSRLAQPEELASMDSLGPLTVPTTTLSILLGGGSGASDIRALVKIDVEGGEVSVLRSAGDLLDSLDRFEALVEVLHLDPIDLDWILERFDVHVFDLEADDLVCVVPSTSERYSALMTDGRYYPQDVVIRPKRRRHRS